MRVSPSHQRALCRVLLGWLVVIGLSTARAEIAESELNPLGVNVSGVTYYSVPHFANALASGGLFSGADSLHHQK